MNNFGNPPHHNDTHSKRQQILDAAYLVFSRKGYHRATVDEIITRAETGKGTVYNYFVNKEQLFYTLIKERSLPFETLLQEVVASSVPPIVKVEHMIKTFLQFYVNNADLWRVMMHEVRGLGSEGYSSFSASQRDKYQEWFNHTIGLLGQVLAEGVAKGVFRSCDVTKAAYGLFSAIVVMVYQDLVSDDLNQTVRAIADIFLYGLVKK